VDTLRSLDPASAERLATEYAEAMANGTLPRPTAFKPRSSGAAPDERVGPSEIAETDREALASFDAWVGSLRRAVTSDSRQEDSRPLPLARAHSTDGS